MQGGQPVQYASRALTETEKHHNQIEKEMLSVVFGLTRFHTYTYVRKVTVHNDRKPLAAVPKRPIGENPIRLQRMLRRIMGYDLDFKYIRGKDLLIADALRRPITPSEPERINHWLGYSSSKCKPYLISRLRVFGGRRADVDLLYTIKILQTRKI